MAAELKRVTLVITSDMEELMDEAKRMFYNRTQSEMIHALIKAGLTAIKTGKDGIPKKMGQGELKKTHPPRSWNS